MSTPMRPGKGKVSFKNKGDPKITPRKSLTLSPLGVSSRSIAESIEKKRITKLRNLNMKIGRLQSSLNMTRKKKNIINANNTVSEEDKKKIEQTYNDLELRLAEAQNKRKSFRHSPVKKTNIEKWFSGSNSSSGSNSNNNTATEPATQEENYGIAPNAAARPGGSRSRRRSRRRQRH